MERRTELDATVIANGEKVQTLNADKAGMLGLKAENIHMCGSHHKVEDVSKIRKKEELDADVEMVNKNIATLKHIRAKLEGRQQ